MTDTATSDAPWQTALAPPEPAPFRAAVARQLLRRVVRTTGIGVGFPDGGRWGDPDAPALRIRDEAGFFRRLGRDGKIGFGEAYMAGAWDADDLVAVLTPMASQMGSLVPRRFQWLRSIYDARHPAGDDNNPNGSRKNISHHYDLSNDLFATFLDETMTYSSALFRPGDDDLSSAQRRKIDRLLDVTEVGTGSRVLEIGTGWGELAIRAAARGAQVVSITLSTAQADLARRRARDAGVGDAVDIRVQDYREVGGRYDAVISVEMIEAVGERWWPTYFTAIDHRLAAGGRAAIQAILMPHERMVASRRSYTWMHKYVFPGGIIPSEQAIDETLRRHTGLRTVDRLHMGEHYAQTLLQWRTRFLAALERVRATGFDDVFVRMWEFYLAYCEAGFRARYLDVAQLLLVRDGSG